MPLRKASEFIFLLNGPVVCLLPSAMSYDSSELYDGFVLPVEREL